jgi:hypothetical protein
MKLRLAVFTLAVATSTLAGAQLIGDPESARPPVGTPRPALATPINGPSAMAVGDGFMYVMESAGRGVFRLDFKSGMATLVLAPSKGTVFG